VRCGGQNSEPSVRGLAGELGVALTDSMVERGHIEMDADAGELTADGLTFLAGLGADLASPVRSRRAFGRPCLDWSERRMHLAGRVGAAIAGVAFQRDWIRRRLNPITLRRLSSS